MHKRSKTYVRNTFALLVLAGIFFLPLEAAAAYPTPPRFTYYFFNTSLKLTATYPPEATFNGWDDACLGLGGCTVIMNADKWMTAMFAPGCYPLTLSHTGNGSDPTVNKANSIDCSTGFYHSGEELIISASPASGYLVGSWSGTNHDSSTSIVVHDKMPAGAHTISVNYVFNAGQPDLVIESILPSLKSPLVHQALQFTVRIRNHGNAVTNSNFIVNLYLDHRPAQNCSDVGSYFSSISSLEAGGYLDLNFTHGGFDTTGVHNLYAFADANCNVLESNETDNILGPISIIVQPDTVLPVVNWVAPAENTGVHPVGNELVTLTASATDNVGVKKVSFFRWDAVSSLLSEIGNAYSDPYSIVFNTQVLNPGWNEIDIVAYDASGNASDFKYLWLDYGDLSSTYELYLPYVFR